MTPQNPASQSSFRRIDHVVLAARDLKAQAEFYRRLGFIVGARNRHPWGTQNHIIQFDGSFIELIAAEPGFHLAADPDPHNFSFSGFIGDFLRKREGGAMIALTTDNAEADARAFKALGIGDFEPFHFGRRGKKPDGASIEVAFTLAFARSYAISDVGFFSCQHHFPQNFWDASFRAHANGAHRLKGVTIIAENPAGHGEFLSHLTGVRAYSASSLGIAFELGAAQAQQIEVLTPVAARRKYALAALDEDADPAIAACHIGVHDGAALREALEANGTLFAVEGDKLVVQAPDAFGIALIFHIN